MACVGGPASGRRAVYGRKGEWSGGLSVVVGRCGDRELGRVACPILVTESDLR